MKKVIILENQTLKRIIDGFLEFKDVLIDSLGAILGLLVYLGIYKLINRKFIIQMNY